MSLRRKLVSVAEQAAFDAMHTERARCLWVIDRTLAELKARLSSKLLSPVQIAASEMKLRIAMGLGMELRVAIVSGVRPLVGKLDEGVTGQSDAADSFSPGPNLGPGNQGSVTPLPKEDA